jgi:hypothetical protein
MKYCRASGAVRRDQAGGEAHMSDMEHSEFDDTEGHALRSQDQDREAATEDVEGHALRSQDQG